MAFDVQMQTSPPALGCGTASHPYAAWNSGVCYRQFGISILAWILLVTMGCQSVRTVESGQVYRVGKLSPARLDQSIEELGIRTVVNLRGIEPEKKWYADEREVCRRRDVKLVDIDLTGSNPDREELLRLFEIFQESQRPILLHSGSSTGNEGFASALYRLAIRKDPKDDARRELAFWQTHRVPWLPGSSLDQFLVDWRDLDRFLDSYQLDRDPSQALASKQAGVTRMSYQQALTQDLDEPRLGKPIDLREWPAMKP